MGSIGSITNVVRSTASKIPEVFAPYAAELPQRAVPYVDMSKDIIVIWVPGTSNHDIHPRFKMHAELHWGDRAELVLSDYAASWNFSASIPDGFRHLKSIVDHVLKNKRPDQKILLAGESQGALIIGELLARPEYYNAITKAVLIGHPGISEKHYEAGDDKVLEINNPTDPATFEWPVGAVEVLVNIDKLFTKKDMGTIPFFLKTAVSAPLFAANLVATQLNRLPIIREYFPHPHNYTTRMYEAILWLDH